MPRNGHEYYKNRINLKGCPHLKKIIHQTVGRMPTLTYNAQAHDSVNCHTVKAKKNNKQRYLNSKTNRQRVSELPSTVLHNISTFGTMQSNHYDKVSSRLSPINVDSNNALYFMDQSGLRMPRSNENSMENIVGNQIQFKGNIEHTRRNINNTSGLMDESKEMLRHQLQENIQK